MSKSKILKRRSVVLTPKNEPEYEKDGEFGAFNPTAAVFNGKEIRLLYRFARRMRQKEFKTKINHNYNKEAHIDYSDLRLAISVDGLKGKKFRKKGVVFKATEKKEALGVEDPRSQKMTDKSGRCFYLVSYVAVSEMVDAFGVTRTGLLSTSDFKHFKRLGYMSNKRKKDGKMAFGDKDTVFFPNKVGGRYWALRRPQFFGEERQITIVSNKNLYSKEWDTGERIFQRKNLPEWAQSHTGAGTQPIEIIINGERKWLEIAHSAVQNRGNTGLVYRAMGLIFGEKNGRIFLEYLCKKPLLEPTTKYEKDGLVSSVVFPTAAILVGNMLKIYYGAGDGVVALAEGSLSEIIEYIMKNSIRLQ